MKRFGVYECHSRVLLLAAVCITAVSLGAAAKQFIMFDGECSWPIPQGHPNRWTGDPIGAWCWRWKLHEAAPMNWVEPVNYKDGSRYIRVEVVSKPVTSTCGFAFSFFPTGWPLGLCHYQFGGNEVEQQRQVYTYNDVVLNVVPDHCQGDHASQWPWHVGTDGGYIYSSCIEGITVRMTVIVAAQGDAFLEPVGWNEFGALHLDAQPLSIADKPAFSSFSMQGSRSGRRQLELYTVLGQRIACHPMKQRISPLSNGVFIISDKADKRPPTCRIILKGF